MRQFQVWLWCFGFYSYIFQQSDASLLDAFVVKEIKGFEKCDQFDQPNINITHKEDYESMTICWRFLTTAFPHCAGNAANLIQSVTDWEGDMLYQGVYQPISGMSEDGRQAGWLGFQLNNNGGTGRQTDQVPWRSILYEKRLKIYEWQSSCVSFSKKTQKLWFFHNGIKYLDYKTEKLMTISRYFLSQVKIAQNFRGSFSDLQVYSTPMEETSLEDWTTCRYDQPGDVFEWDINKVNLTHDERIVSSIEKVDSKLFCKPEQKEVHIFGDSRIDTFSNFEGIVLCERLNSKAVLFPTNGTRIEELVNYLTFFAEKTNLTSGVEAWVSGVSKLDDKYGSSHWYPPGGVYELIDPENGNLLLNDENRKLILPDGHTYQKLVHICPHITTNPFHYPPFSFGVKEKS